jgi:hypothetical protein
MSLAPRSLPELDGRLMEKPRSLNCRSPTNPRLGADGWGDGSRARPWILLDALSVLGVARGLATSGAFLGFRCGLLQYRIRSRVSSVSSSDPELYGSPWSLPFEVMISSSTGTDDPDPLEGVFRGRLSFSSLSVTLNLERSIELLSRRFSGRWVRDLELIAVWSGISNRFVAVGMCKLVGRDSYGKITLSHSTECNRE